MFAKDNCLCFQVNHMKTGYKVTYRCNSWRRLGCHYSMYAIHNKEDGRISLHERGQHIHPLVPAPRKSIGAFKSAFCTKLTLTNLQWPPQRLCATLAPSPALVHRRIVSIWALTRSTSWASTTIKYNCIRSPSRNGDGLPKRRCVNYFDSLSSSFALRCVNSKRNRPPNSSNPKSKLKWLI